jgi:serine protease Do
VRHKPRPGPGTTRLGTRSPAVLPLLLLLLIATVGGALTANADEGKPLVPQRLFDQSRPGVELIMAEFKAEMTVPRPTITAANRRALQELVASRVSRGEIPPTGAAARDAAVEEVARDPFRWYTRSGQVDRADLKVLAVGSGFSVSADGYIVTNAHVAAPRERDLKATFLREELGDEGDDVIQSLVEGGLPQRLATRLLEARVRWATKMGKLSHLRRRLRVATSGGTGGVFSSGNGLAAKLVTAGKQIPGKDVAILKVDAREMATVRLGDDTALSAGDRLFVLGFPAPATFNPVLSKQSQKEPTLTQGVLSAKKTASEGFAVLQTDAAMTRGNSGGPVFDEQGSVVGVATFGPVDPRTGREVAGTNLAVPVSVVGELLSQAGIKPVEGTATSKFRLALDALEKRWYKRALPLLQDVKWLNPSHPSVGRFIRDSETAIRQGRDRSPREVLGLPLMVFAAAAGLLLVGVLAAALARRGRRARQSRDVSGTPAFEARQGPVRVLSQGPPRPAPGTQAAVEQGGWWPGEPLAPVGPVGSLRSGGNGTNGGPTVEPPAHTVEPPAPAQTSGQPAHTVEPPAQTGGQPAPRPVRRRRSARHDWWQREWHTTDHAGPAEARTATSATAATSARPRRPQSLEPLVCGNCGHASPATGRFCEQCWSVLGS